MLFVAFASAVHRYARAMDKPPLRRRPLTPFIVAGHAEALRAHAARTDRDSGRSGPLTDASAAGADTVRSPPVASASRPPATGCAARPSVEGREALHPASVRPTLLSAVA